MKRLSLLALLASLIGQVIVFRTDGGGGGTGIQLVAFASAGTASANNAVSTAAINTTDADLLVACVTDATAVTTVFSDSASNTWIPTTRRTVGGSGAARIYYVASPVTSATHTATVGAQTGSLASVTLMAFSGADAAPFDVEGGSTAVATASITPTVNGALLVTCYQDSASSAIFTTATGYPTAPLGGHAVVGGNRFAHFASYGIQRVAASVSVTISANAVLSPSHSIVAFKRE